MPAGVYAVTCKCGALYASPDTPMACISCGQARKSYSGMSSTVYAVLDAMASDDGGVVDADVVLDTAVLVDVAELWSQGRVASEAKALAARVWSMLDDLVMSTAPEKPASSTPAEATSQTSAGAGVEAGAEAGVEPANAGSEPETAGGGDDGAGDELRASLAAMGYSAAEIAFAMGKGAQNVRQAISFLDELATPATIDMTQLRSMGFEESSINDAIAACGNDQSAVMEWLLARM
ncbi:uncharacterized protein AMSG_03808 [Thecamonas trahens ATCC 50062]|uniref:UBA domain-containing protein n=1 Tax=Thecamonas trahens ATCC 50062 TaxID=461836 RepID=A0A0L0D4W8_THETB|nr:hypothetical protein AMSG_03808 [Thecamonas trahens ATCC 50062]KNC47374.1 hypothetical protein AMSG_03808 [Thecamonas trahens ATCC 50062]|eukprot:XP_013759712.1 hypothetical protein AMSG_03808 [Thecamonas trahens ATCC 50062]